MHRTILDTPIVNTALRDISLAFLKVTGGKIEGSRHPGPRLPAPALRRVRARQAAGVQLQAARLVPLVRRAADVADGSAPGGPCHPARAGAPVGASLSTSAADPAARVAGRAARAGHAGAAGGAAGGRTASAGPHGAQERRRSGRRGHAEPALRLGCQPQYSPALPGAGRRGWSRRWGRPGWPSRMPTASRRARCGRCRPQPSLIA